MRFLQLATRWKNIFLYSLVFIVAASVAYAAQNYRVNVGQTLFISEFSKNVANNCASDIFIPTNTVAEQTSFLTSKPACVSLADSAWITVNFTTPGTSNWIVPGTGNTEVEIAAAGAGGGQGGSSWNSIFRIGSSGGAGGNGGLGSSYRVLSGGTSLTITVGASGIGGLRFDLSGRRITSVDRLGAPAEAGASGAPSRVEQNAVIFAAGNGGGGGSGVAPRLPNPPAGSPGGGVGDSVTVGGGATGGFIPANGAVRSASGLNGAVTIRYRFR